MSASKATLETPRMDLDARHASAMDRVPWGGTAVRRTGSVHAGKM